MKKFETKYKNGEKIIKSDDTVIWKCKFHQHQTPFSIENKDINKIVVSNKVSFCKKDLNFFFEKKMLKKLDLYVSPFQIWLYTAEILRKLNECLFS